MGVAEVKVLKPAKKNMLPAEQKPQVIDDYLAKELKEGRITRPFSPPSARKPILIGSE